MKNENMELDELIETIGQWILEDEAGPRTLNPLGMERIQFPMLCWRKWQIVLT